METTIMGLYGDYRVYFTAPRTGLLLRNLNYVTILSPYNGESNGKENGK